MGPTRPAGVISDMTGGREAVRDSSANPQTATGISLEAAVNRRRFLGNLATIAGAAAATAALAPASAALAMLTAPSTPRRLKFYNLHTGEQLDVVYYEKG